MATLQYIIHVYPEGFLTPVGTILALIPIIFKRHREHWLNGYFQIFFIFIIVIITIVNLTF